MSSVCKGPEFHSPFQKLSSGVSVDQACSAPEAYRERGVHCCPKGGETRCCQSLVSLEQTVASLRATATTLGSVSAVMGDVCTENERAAQVDARQLSTLLSVVRAWSDRLSTFCDSKKLDRDSGDATSDTLSGLRG